MKPSSTTAGTVRHRRREAGLTLIEMLVTLVIGSFLVLGAVTMFTQSRTSYRTTDSTSRLQENARFAFSEIEPDLRLTQFWGMTNKGALVSLPAALPAVPCGGNNVNAWALSVTTPIRAWNSGWPTALAGVCLPFNNTQRPNTDSFEVRHASGNTIAANNGTIQLASTRTNATLFNNGVPPVAQNCAVAIPTSCIYNLQANLYYVDSQSSLGATTPSLRRLTLGANGAMQDQEIIAGVEDMQIQLGVDTNNDGTVDRYVDPNHALVTPGAAGYNPTARMLAVRVWLLLRAESAETGFTDSTVYQYANVPAFTRNDGFRRMLVSKTILLRNARG